MGCENMFSNSRPNGVVLVRSKRVPLLSQSAYTVHCAAPQQQGWNRETQKENKKVS